VSSLSKCVIDGNFGFDLSRVKPGSLAYLAIGKNCHSLFLFEILTFALEKKKERKKTN